MKRERLFRTKKRKGCVVKWGNESVLVSNGLITVELERSPPKEVSQEDT